MDYSYTEVETFREANCTVYRIHLTVDGILAAHEDGVDDNGEPVLVPRVFGIQIMDDVQNKPEVLRKWLDDCADLVREERSPTVVISSLSDLLGE